MAASAKPDDVEAKLDMSLDELLAAKRINGDAEYGAPAGGSSHVQRRRDGAGAGRRNNSGRGRGPGRQNWPGSGGGPMHMPPGQPWPQQQQQQQQQQPWYPQQQPFQQQGMMGPAFGFPNNGWGFQPFQQQQQQQHAGRGFHPDNPRGSVFNRLGQHQQQGPPGGRPIPPPPQYKLALAQDAGTGTVTVTFRDTTIIQVRPSGEVVLDTCGQRTKPFLGALNQALNKINLKVTSAPAPPAAPGLPPAPEAVWSVSDGRSLQRFEDGMVVPAKGAATAARGRLLLRAHGVAPLAAVQSAASAASTRAAVAAGLVKASDVDMADAAPGGGGEGGEDGDAEQQRQQLVFEDGDLEYGATEGPEAARLRRLKAQGRLFSPY